VASSSSGIVRRCLPRDGGATLDAAMLAVAVAGVAVSRPLVTSSAREPLRESRRDLSVESSHHDEPRRPPAAGDVDRRWPSDA
jgi:hypothetical protein